MRIHGVVAKNGALPWFNGYPDPREVTLLLLSGGTLKEVVETAYAAGKLSTVMNRRIEGFDDDAMALASFLDRGTRLSHEATFAPGDRSLVGLGHRLVCRIIRHLRFVRDAAPSRFEGAPAVPQGCQELLGEPLGPFH